MNIGVFTDTFKPCTNGVVDAVWRVCKGFKKEGHNVHLFALSDSDGEEKIEGIYVHKFKGKQFKFYPDFLIRYSLPLRRIFNIINRYRIEVIHSNLNLIMGLSALIVSNRKKIPLITTFHTLVPEFIDCFLGSFDNGGNKPMLLNLLQVVKVDKPLIWLARKFVWYWMRYFNTSEWLIAPSNYTKKILVSHGLNAKKIIVVPNPIDIKLQKNVKKESNLILHVGRLSPEKRVDVFIKSLKYVKHNFKAVITSDGPLRKYLEELAKKEGVAKKVKFTGFIPKKDLDNYYSKSAIFVSAAEYDTFNNCVAEALGHGTPVIISKNSGATDFVKHNKNGIIINNDDPIEYAKKIDWMLFNNEFRETVNKAGEKIRAYTDINVIIKSIEELYKNATRSSFFKKLKDFTIYSIGAIFCYTVIIGGSLLERK